MKPYYVVALAEPCCGRGSIVKRADGDWYYQHENETVDAFYPDYLYGWRYRKPIVRDYDG